MSSKFALIIANTDYEDPGLSQLVAPGKDAKDFWRVLASPDVAAFNDVIILFNENASKVNEIIDHFFSDRKPDDLLLLYFSGHGVRDENGALYLAVKNTNRKRLRSTAIKSDFIRDAMDQCRSRRQILILDCCNSGAFAQGTKAETGGSIGTAKAFEGTGYGRIVLTASDSTQFAWEGDQVIGSETSNSLFTHFLVKGLEGEADRDGDGKISVDDLYEYAYEEIVNKTSKQTPGKWIYKQQGDIVLRENLKIRDVKPASVPSDLLEILSHPNSGVRRAGIQELATLLDGSHLGLARAAQDKLRQIMQSDDSLTLRKAVSETLISHGIKVQQPAPPVSVEVPKAEPKKETKADKSAVKPTPVVTKPLPSLEKQPTQQKLAPNVNLRLLVGIAGGLSLIVLFVWGGANLLKDSPGTATEDPDLNALNTEAAQTLQAQMVQFEQTSSPSLPTQPPLTQTPVPPTPTLGVSSTMTGEDGMTLLYVPAGEFTMGSDKVPSNEGPAHTVYLDAYWIDLTEVTNEMYAGCVNDGKCNEPSNTVRFSDSNYEDHPVFYVSLDDAINYCSWTHRRLPTEAEWEKAASWNDQTKEKYVYPWGNEFSCKNGNFDDETELNGDAVPGGENCDGFPRTSPVGSFSGGTSPYGALDMAGNVWEWVTDWFSATYYVSSPLSNPLGPDSGDYRILRGGSWGNIESFIESTKRVKVNTDTATNQIGFRCAMSATP